MSEHENTNIYVQDTPSVWSKLRDELRENIVNTVVPEGVSEDKYLKEIVYKGLSEKIVAAPPIYIQRLDHELGKIREYGYTDVFLFLWDIFGHCLLYYITNLHP